MRYVLDTHALLWFLTRDTRLSERVRALMQKPETQFIVPAISLAEAKYIADRRRVAIGFTEVLESVASSPNFTIAPLDLAAIIRLPQGLDIHDALIVATALATAELANDEVTVLTADLSITAAGIVPTYW